uniref:Uncharacterized protein n=1 Tax=Macaca fascicularis TaxID=9541 RepID=A0A7N9DB61_MACFA
MVAYTCNPSTFGGRGGWWITRSGGRDHPGQHSKTSSLLKTQKINWVWWHMSVIPATQEAEIGSLMFGFFFKLLNAILRCPIYFPYIFVVLLFFFFET